MICEFFDTLAQQNAHARDKSIKLDHDTHIYEVVGFPPGYFTSVTTWKAKLFPEFDKKVASKRCELNPKPSRYAGLTSTQIEGVWDEGAELGRWFHRDIEGFLNDNILPPGYSNADLLQVHEIAHLELHSLPSSIPKPIETKEWQFFMRFVRDHPHLKPYRTEWMIYHEEYRLTGTIDAVFTTNHPKDGKPIFLILDWKRSRRKLRRQENTDRKPLEKTLWFAQDSDYWRFAVQLNLYRIILIDKYDIRSDHMYIVRLHPDATSYQVMRMPILDHWLRPLLQNQPKQ